MQEKSSSTSNRNHPRIPPEHGGVQVNHCKSPFCVNYGVAPEQTSVRGKNRYTLERSKGIASCICTFCRVEFPLKSNLGIIEVTDIAPQTFYHRLAFFHRQCQAFAAHRERALANLAIRRLYLGVDRQDYLVNWLFRKDKRNIQLSAIAAVDNENGYCFGVHLNFDPSLDAAAIQAEVETNGDLHMPNPHRRFARLWLNTDHDDASSRSMTTKRRNLSLSTAINDTYAVALTRDDIESPDAPSSLERLPEYGMQIHGEYTMYGHFFFLKRLLGNVQKWRFFIDPVHYLSSLWQWNHSPTSSQSDWYFFCNTNNAAASASAFSLRVNSRANALLASFSSRSAAGLTDDTDDVPASKAARHYCR